MRRALEGASVVPWLQVFCSDKGEQFKPHK